MTRRKQNFDGVRFGGETYDHEKDGPRLRTQMKLVFALMRDGKERNVPEVKEILRFGDASVAAIGARLRDLRKEEFGAYDMQSRRDTVDQGLWWYRLVLDEAGQPKRLTPGSTETI